MNLISREEAYKRTANYEAIRENFVRETLYEKELTRIMEGIARTCDYGRYEFAWLFDQNNYPSEIRGKIHKHDEERLHKMLEKTLCELSYRIYTEHNMYGTRLVIKWNDETPADTDA